MQRAGASRAEQRAGGQGGLGPDGVGDPDHRGTVEARRTGMVYQHRRREGPAGVAADPSSRPNGPPGSTPVELVTLTTHRSRRMRSCRDVRVRRHGGDADEPHVHPSVVVTVNGAEVAGWSSLREAFDSKRGVAFNNQGQRVGCPHVACWADTATVLAADRVSERDDPRPHAPEPLRRALAGLPASAPGGSGCAPTPATSLGSWPARRCSPRWSSPSGRAGSRRCGGSSRASPTMRGPTLLTWRMRRSRSPSTARTGGRRRLGC